MNQQAGEFSTNPFVFDGRGAYGGSDRENYEVFPKRSLAASQGIFPNGVLDCVVSSKRSGVVRGGGEDEYLGVVTPFPGLSGVSSSVRAGVERRNEGGDPVSGRVDYDRGFNRDTRHGGALRTPGR